MTLGEHAGFIIAAYAVAVVVTAALVAWVVLDCRAQQRALANLQPRDSARAGKD